VTGILHIGVGAFHRVHQCFYFDALARDGSTDCGVFGVSLRSDDTRDFLAPQDYLYTLSLLSEPRETRVIGCVRAMETGTTGFDVALSLFGNASLKLVTLTVTEKGYGAESKELVNFLIEGLRRRRAVDRPLVIPHLLTQIAEDGNVKRKERVLPLLLIDSDAARKNNLLCFPLVLWMNHVSQIAHEGGQLKDPFGDRLICAVKDASTQQIVFSCLDSLDAAHRLPDTTTDLLGKMLVQILTEGIRLMVSKMANE
jgi:mannitol-1-phosphate/altronate dehydrogenase